MSTAAVLLNGGRRQKKNDSEVDTLALSKCISIARAILSCMNFNTILNSGFDKVNYIATNNSHHHWHSSLLSSCYRTWRRLRISDTFTR